MKEEEARCNENKRRSVAKKKNRIGRVEKTERVYWGDEGDVEG